MTAAVIVVAVIGLGGDSTHRVSAVFSSATNMTPGLDVRAAGVSVGTINAIHRDGGQTRFDLDITDDRVWPLHEGTTATLRWGGTIGYASRYVELTPGRSTARTVEDGALIPSKNTSVPTEVDQVLSTYDAPTRGSLKALLSRGQDALSDTEALRASFDKAPPALRQVRDVLGDLGDDPVALTQLLRSTDAVAGAARRAQPDVQQLIANAAQTFTATAEQANALRSTLSELPPTLTTTRTVLARTDGSLKRVDRLARRIAPGVATLRRLVPTAAAALQRLRAVGPDARATLATARRTSPGLRDLLDAVGPFASVLAPVAKEAARQMECIRPYAPEIAGVLTTWVGWTQNYDGHGKYGRSLTAAAGDAGGLPGIIDSQTVASAPINQKYAYPRPPGLNVGRPWFLPQCNVGPDSLDASKDPESARNLPKKGRR